MIKTNFFSYRLAHDYGLAPNPFGGHCTLAVCKSQIRNNKRLKTKDWIFGTGSKHLKSPHHLIYAMQMEEKLTFDEYWADDRFQYKKPIINGSLVQMHGDNFYHTNPETGEWIQENSAHSSKDGVPNSKHINRDTKSEYVLISKTFFYFGNNAIQIPEQFLEICSGGRAPKSIAIPLEVGNGFVVWLQNKYKVGLHGNPINWKDYRKND